MQGSARPTAAPAAISLAAQGARGAGGHERSQAIPSPEMNISARGVMRLGRGGGTSISRRMAKQALFYEAMPKDMMCRNDHEHSIRTDYFWTASNAC